MIMGRAFTREIDDGPLPPVLERAISAARNLVTPSGARKVEAKIADLDAGLKSAAGGDIDALKRALRYWQARRASMEIVAHEAPPEAVRSGASVIIRRETRQQVLTIVGEDEAEPQAGLLARTSSLARALDGAIPGEAVEFEPGGRQETHSGHFGRCRFPRRETAGVVHRHPATATSERGPATLWPSKCPNEG